jgi:hypothetical protein
MLRRYFEDGLMTKRKPKQSRLSLQTALADLESQPTIPVWPHCGVLLNLSRGATYQAARSGQLPVIKIGRLRKVLTGPLRRQLGLDA